MNTQTPEYLTKRGAAVWAELAPTVAKRLRDDDIPAFADYCETLAQVRELQTQAEDTPYYELSGKGNIYMHPLYNSLRSAQKTLRKLETELGMTPKARKEKVEPPAKEVDPLERFRS